MVEIFEQTQDAKSSIAAFLIVVLALASTFIVILSQVSSALFLTIVVFMVGLAAISLAKRRVGILFFLAILPFMDLAKRLLFLADSVVPRILLYGLLILPDLILAALVMNLIVNIRRNRTSYQWNETDWLVVAFLGVALLATLANQRIPPAARLASIERQVFPILMFFVAGATIKNGADWNGLRKVALASGMVVALYGFGQALTGLLPFERAWYEASTDFSVTASNMLISLEDYGFFRPFATLADHTSFGYFMGMCAALSLTLHTRRQLRLGKYLLAFCFSLATFLSLTRITYLSLVITVFFAWVLKRRVIRHPLRMTILVLVAPLLVFGIVFQRLYRSKLFGFDYFYLRRIFNTGTLVDRIHWGAQLPNAISKAGLLGEGLADSTIYASKFGFVTSTLGSHNMIIEGVEQVGLLGVLILFYLCYTILRRSFYAIHFAGSVENYRIMLMVFGLVLSWLIAGHTNGAVFYVAYLLGCYFWAFCGALAHWQQRVKVVEGSA